MALDGDLDVTQTPDTVEFTLAVSNPDPNVVDLRFATSLVADFTVLDGDREVWRYSDGRMFTQERRTERLEPGESLVVSASWREPTPGAYRVRATLHDETQDLAREALFSV